MLLLLQFPVADLRSFIDGEDYRAPATTAFATTRKRRGATADLRDAPFIRDMGPLRRRQQGLRIAGEALYFRARNAIRFAPGLRAIPDPRGGDPIPLELVFRRFQAYAESDTGQAHRLAKYEMAWVLATRQPGKAALEAAELELVVATCLALPVTVAQFDCDGHQVESTLVNAGGPLARQLRFATTLGPGSPRHLAPDWALAACKPALLVEYGTAELAATPTGPAVVRFANAPELGLHCIERAYSKQPVQCWFLRSDLRQVQRSRSGELEIRSQHEGAARNFRVALLRQHAEREVLAHALDCLIEPGRLALDGVGGAADAIPSTPARSELKKYLLSSAAILRRRSRESRQLPLAGDIDRLEPAALVVDENDPERFQDLGECLTLVLGPELMTELRQALNLLPMGEQESSLRVAQLLQRHRPRPLRVAVSYSHRDRQLLDRFKASTHRDALTGVIERWDDLLIPEGAEWDPEIRSRFRAADVLVLLLTDTFLASSYIMRVEVPLALERRAASNAALLPVVCAACNWTETPLGVVQGVRPFGRPVVEDGSPGQAAAWSYVRHRMYVAASDLFSAQAAGVGV